MTDVKSDDKWISGQAHQDIVTIGDPALKRPVQPIIDFGSSAELFEHMVARLRQLNGAGLAAPQIGHSVAVIVVEVRRTDVFPDRPTSPLILMANPKIIEQSEETEQGWEGCFSVPGMMGLVSRYSRIRVRFQTPDGNDNEESYSGYLARVIQHEIDHLAAVEFIDHMETMESLTTVHNYLQFHR